MANSYRMTEEDIKQMIRLRASNAAIFTGRRNSAMSGWRAVKKEMGLQGLVSVRKLKKKWENMRDKYRILKYPPIGMENETKPSSWRWFHIMDEAMTGCLAESANIIQPSLTDDEDDEVEMDHQFNLSNSEGTFSGLNSETVEDIDTLGLQISGLESCGNYDASNRSESSLEPVGTGVGTVTVRSHECAPSLPNHQTTVLYATLLPDSTATVAGNCPPGTNDTTSTNTTRSRNIGMEAATEIDKKLAELVRERQALEKEQAEFDRELIAQEKDRELLRREKANLEREKTLLERDRAAVKRDRTALERDRTALERDRLVLDRDRAFLDRDRAFLERDRVFIEQSREDIERQRSLLKRELAILQRGGTSVDREQTEVTTEKEVLLQTRFYQSVTSVDPDQLESRQRLVSLFQKLVEKL